MTKGGRLIGTVLIGTGFLSQPVFAAQDGPGVQESGEQILVTAQRRSEKLSDVPISITAMTRDDMQRTGVVGTTDLAAVTPGLQFPVNGAFAQPTIRGIGTTVTSAGSDANVAIYVDGVYMPSQAGNIFGFNNVEQIEVLKGPQGTLYGRNATGGAINITTSTPSFTPRLRLSADYGSFDAVRLNAYATRALSDHVAFDIAALYSDDNGYARDVLRGVPLAFNNERAIRGKVLAELSPNLKLTLAADWARKTDTVGYTLKPLDDNTAIAAAIIPASPREFALSLTPDFTTRNYGGSAKFALSLDGGGTVTALTSLRRVLAHFLTDLDRSQVNSSVAEFSTRQRTFTQELNFASAPDKPFSIVAGLYYYNDRANNDNLKINGVQGVTGQIRSEAISGYAEGTLRVSDPFSIIVGARYNHETRTFDASRLTGSPLTLSSSRSWSSVTPKVALRYAVSPSTNLYASYTSGFKSGTYNISSFSTTPVDPEKVSAFEGGLKWHAGGATANLAGFFYRYRDIQIQAIQVLTGLTALTNAARAEIYGLEGDFRVPVTAEFSVSGGAAYTHGIYTSFPGALITTPRVTGCAANNPHRPCGNTQAPGDASGNRMVRTPRWTGNLTGTYRKQAGFGLLDASATLSYNSGYFWDVGNRVEQKPFTLINARVGITPHNSPVTIALWGRNLTNKVYHAYANDTTTADAVSYARPRSFGVTVSLDIK